MRSLQLAKGAIHSGWELLLDSLGVPLEELDTVYIAGAFGNYLDLAAAQYLGLFPPVATQARRVRRQRRRRRRPDGAHRRAAPGTAWPRCASRIEFLDLATDKRFLDVFAGRLGFAGD